VYEREHRRVSLHHPSLTPQADPHVCLRCGDSDQIHRWAPGHWADVIPAPEIIDVVKGRGPRKWRRCWTVVGLRHFGRSIAGRYPQSRTNTQMSRHSVISYQHPKLSIFDGYGTYFVS
jgi:hypothetical protein